MFFKSLLILLLLANLMFAGGFDIDFFKDKPRSKERDFFIWLFLERDDITPRDAVIAEKLVYSMNDMLLHRIAKFTNNRKIITESFCKRVTTQKILHLSDVCIDTGLSTYEATTLSKDELSGVVEKLKPNFPNRAKVFEIINSNKVFVNTILSEPKMFFEIFNYSGGNFRLKHFDNMIPKKYIDIFSSFKEFDETIFHIVTSLKFQTLSWAILDVNTTHLSFQSIFYLALNAIRLNKLDLALNYLNKAYEKAFLPEEKDRIVLWKYLLTGDNSYLITLINSNDINIYSLYAFEKLNKNPTNIITDVNITKKNDVYDIKDVFWWLGELAKIKNFPSDKLVEYANQFSTQDTMPHKAYILQKSDFSKRYFITPYLDYITLITPDERAMLYAIAKQESNFIPTTISTSYALGIMQFLPYVAKNTAKSLKILNFKLLDMFDPQKSMLISSFHIEYLRKHLKHPLFIAYGYNGGINFTKKTIIDRLFDKNQKFEPFMSIELIPQHQAREYGKKVLANYIIYYNLFGGKISTNSILRSSLYTF